MNTDFVALESLFLGLADKTRLRLLGLMAAGPVSVGYLVVETGESQPKISRHLAYLRNAGLVETTRDGKWVYYGVAEMADPSAESVYRCVVAELSGKAAPANPIRASQPLPETEIQRDVEEDVSSAEGFYESDWENSSDAGHNELDVFLL
jgi:DNA-binding transcriptional ArsR family regulator